MSSSILNIYNDNILRILQLDILPQYQQLVFITDDIIHQLYSSQLSTILDYYNDREIESIIYTFPNSELSKTIETKISIEEFMLQHHIKRSHSCIISIGGGVCGDLSGYIASTYKRGIDLIHIPTTLLAMVDSSIGGKNGINNKYGKNLIGTFHLPKYILIFTHFITSLPRIEIINGFAEIIKTAAITNIYLWNLLIQNTIDTIITNPKLLVTIIKETAQTKLNIVEKDLYDNSISKSIKLLCPREHLNFGHTIGHIIEYTQNIKHGLAVAIGMIMEVNIQLNNRYYVGINTRHQLVECIRRYELPIKLTTPINKLEIEQYLINDKKDGRIVILEEIGNSYIIKPYINQIIDLFYNQRHIYHNPKHIYHNPNSIDNNPNSIDNNQNSIEQEPITYIGPGSKSETNRVLILTALGNGKCIIKNPLLSDDTLYMVNALKELNFNIEIDDENNIQIEGSNGKLIPTGNKTLYIGNSGTCMRFLLSLMYLLEENTICLTGDERMKDRPIQDLLDTLVDSGITLETSNPITIVGSKTTKKNYISLNCSLSSQYLTGLMLVGSCIPDGLKIYIINDLVSRQFIDMTITIMNKFGINVEWCKELNNHYIYIPYKLYNNPDSYQIEADATSCSYPIAYSILNQIPLYIPNLTSMNSQGDLFYSTTIIQKLGDFNLECNENGTTISNFNSKNKILSLCDLNEIDMDSSDTFLTIAVLASLTSEGNKTTIINIDNQNIKECNRIEVIYQHLKNAGVNILLENNQLTIYGSINQLTNKLIVDSNNDHRIAMSLSLLAPFIPELIIDDYLCVNKTYSNYWLDMTKLGLTTQMNRVEIDNRHWNYKSKIPIVLIGMPCSGKTLYSKQLIRNNLITIDIDQRIETIHRLTPHNYIIKYGWEQFRETEYKILVDILDNDKSTPFDIISTGGGIIEYTQSYQLLDRLKQEGKIHIIYLQTSLDTIKKRFEARKDKVPYTKSLEELYHYRNPIYDRLASYIYDTDDVKIDNYTRVNTIQDFYRFIRNIYEKKELVANSLFVCLPFNQIDNNLTNLNKIIDGSDVLEIRLDYCPDIENNLQLIQQKLITIKKLIYIPIIVTIRSKKEWGLYQGGIQSTIQRCIKLGIEYIDYELNQSQTIIDRKHSIMIGSIHTDDYNYLINTLSSGCKLHKPDLLKIVVSYNIYHLVEPHLNQYYSKYPKILIAIGKEGSITRITNKYLTPITSEYLDSTAPGQLTYPQIKMFRDSLQINQTPEFYLFGFPIQKSPSPSLHNYVFSKTKINGEYYRLETNYIENIIDIIKRPLFTGASITIPFKETILEYMHEIDVEVEQIGSINTIVKTEEGKLKGYNTDWKAVYDIMIDIIAGKYISNNNNLITKKNEELGLNNEELGVNNEELGIRNDKLEIKNPIILGNGGTAKAVCYSLNQLNIKPIIQCRNIEKAKISFSNLQVDKYKETLELNIDSNLIINCLPPEVQINYDILQPSTYIINMGYLPNKKLILRNDLYMIDGYTILKRQAYYQYLLWFLPTIDTKNRIKEWYDGYLING